MNKCKATKLPCTSPRCPENKNRIGGSLNSRASDLEDKIKDKLDASKSNFAPKEIVDARWEARHTDNIEVLEQATKSDDILVRINASFNPNLTDSLVRNLWGDNDYGVRNGIASNPSVSSDYVIALTRDKDIFVRSSAVKNLKRRGEAIIQHEEGACPDSVYGERCDGLGYAQVDPYSSDVNDDYSKIVMCNGVYRGRQQGI